MSGIQSTQSSSPLLSPPIANGISSGGYATLPNLATTTMTMADVIGTATDATLVDVVNYAGAGVVEFALAQAIAASVACRMVVTIDGAVVVDATCGTTSIGSVICPIGSANLVASGQFSVAPGAVPFLRSLRIQVAGNASGGAKGYCKYRKTA